MITTTLGDRDEAELLKHDDVVDNDHEHTTVVEYCLKDCPGAAHQTGQATGAHCFCERHIHRSAHVTLKRWPEGMSGAIGQFG